MRFKKRLRRWCWGLRNPDRTLRPGIAPILAAGIMCASPFFGQSTQPNAGQLDLTLQGYALTQQGQTSYITGPALQFSEFLPGRGLFSGRLEGLARDGRVSAGDNYLQFRGFAAFNLRWSVQAGDFRVPSGMVDNIFQNVYYPEISARGFKVEADRPDWTFTLFGGSETLLEGPRVPFRRRVPQSVAGASIQRKTDGRWQIGVRLLGLAGDSADIERFPNLFPANRRVQTSISLAVQSVYSWTKALKIFQEGTLAATRRLTPSGTDGPFSGLAGVAFDNATWTAKINYTYQTASYLPLLGYFAGDRQGPFSEIRFRPLKWVDMFGSFSSYRNNLERDSRVPVFQSRSRSAGGVLLLPWKFSLSAQITDIRFTAGASQTTAPSLATNRQWGASVARPLKHQTLRVGYRDLNLGSSALSSRQRSAEIEDTVLLKQLSFGGALRLQQTTGEHRTNTVFARCFLQAHVGRLRGFAQVENGNDLLNRSLFATSNFRTMVAGITVRLWKGWDLQAEAFRNQLTSELNPENAFLQLGQGVPAHLLFAGFNQQSTYIRLSKHFAWGETRPAGGIDRYADAQNLLRGRVQGTVRSMGLAGPLPARGVTVSLDGYRSVATGEQGAFLLPDVPVGSHSLALALQELPAEYDPGPAFEVTVRIDPGRSTAVTLEVWRLGSIHGVLISSDRICRENSRLRLQPTGRYTTSDPDGTFSFENLREGEYTVILETVPTSITCALQSVAEQRRQVRSDVAVPPIRFELQAIETVKPIRRIVLQPQQ